MKEIDLSGKTALVTGATRGIGLGIAAEFLSAGADLLVTGTRRDGKDLIMKKLQTINVSQKIEYVQADFGDAESTASFLNTLKGKEKIDICVNNAGINNIKAIKDISSADIEFLHRVNLHVPLLILSVVLEKMKENNWGRVVNIGSLWSTLSRSGRALYTSGKHGLKGLTVTAALEYAPFNVLVNMVSPGFVETDLTRASLSAGERVEIENRIPVGRLATTEDIARAVLFLCCEMNSYITGQNIFVDGGYTCE